MRRTIAMVVLIVATFMDLMDAMITNVALPSIERDLAASSAELEWTVSAYVLLFAVLLVTGGRLGDLWGRKSVFLVGVAGFTIASAAATVAPTSELLVWARGLQGAFAALMVPQVLATAQALYAPHERAKVFGAMGALGGLGVLAGQLLGGWLVTVDAFGLGWRSVFVINVPVGVALFVVALVVVPQTRSERRPALDLAGTGLAIVGAMGIMFALVEGAARDWDALIWVVLVAGVAATVGFCVLEHRREAGGSDVLLPMRLFRDRSFAVGGVVQLSNYLGWGSFALMIAIYTQEALGFTALEAGLTMVPVTVGSFIGTALAPIAARLGRAAVVAGGVVQAIGFAGYAWTIHVAGDGLTVWSLAPSLLLTGIGMILFAVPLMSLTLRDVPTDDGGAASGALSMFQQLGSALGVAVVGLVFFQIIGSGESTSVYEHAIVSGTFVTIAAFATAGVAALLLPRRAAPVADAAADPTGVDERGHADATRG